MSKTTVSIGTALLAVGVVVPPSVPAGRRAMRRAPGRLPPFRGSARPGIRPTVDVGPARVARARPTGRCGMTRNDQGVRGAEAPEDVPRPRREFWNGVAVLDDDEDFARLLARGLRLEGHETVTIGLPCRGAPPTLLSSVLHARAATVVLDLDLGLVAGDGERLVEPLSRLGFATVVLSGIDDDARLGRCLLHGARAVVSKSAPLDFILRTV